MNGDVEVFYNNGDKRWRATTGGFVATASALGVGVA